MKQERRNAKMKYGYCTYKLSGNQMKKKSPNMLCVCGYM